MAVETLHLPKLPSECSHKLWGFLSLPLPPVVHNDSLSQFKFKQLEMRSDCRQSSAETSVVSLRKNRTLDSSSATEDDEELKVRSIRAK